MAKQVDHFSSDLPFRVLIPFWMKASFVQERADWVDQPEMPGEYAIQQHWNRAEARGETIFTFSHEVVATAFILMFC